MERNEREALSRAMARLADGDRAAFPSVYASVRSASLALARRMVGAEAEDVAQQALIDVFERAGEYDPERDAMAWILGITAWRCRTHRKKAARRREVPLEAAPARAASADPERSIEHRALLDAVEEILGALGPRDTEVILAAADLVERPDVKPAAYRKRLERALVRFKRAWEARQRRSPKEIWFREAKPPPDGGARSGGRHGDD